MGASGAAASDGAGQRIRTAVPSPGAESMVTSPPACATRSLMDTRSPRRSVGMRRWSNPTPSSTTSIATPSSPWPEMTSVRVMVSAEVPACWRLFIIACTAAE
ncbi:hypothetical protein MAFF212519_03540 [Clavibacter michiganensis]